MPDPGTSRLEYFKVLPQYLLPHHLVSGLAFRLARCKWGPCKNFLIRSFIRRFAVDLREAQQEAIGAFPDFNAFFTRELKSGIRPIAGPDAAVVSPVDGQISQIGVIHGGDIIQAKGRSYTAASLFGDGGDGSAPFADGRFITLYLAPRNYHRVHLPLRGRLEQMTYLPGRLFSVNADSTDRINGLFARNERILCRFVTDCGPMIVCMVGALLVGGMETVWHGQVTPAGVRRRMRCDYNDGRKPITYDKGAEIARFNMGSTVILLFEKDAVEWESDLAPGTTVKMGQKIGTASSTFPSP